MSALYETDFNAWVHQQTELLKKRDFEHIDLQHLLEEMVDLGTSNKFAIESHLIILLMHMLKQQNAGESRKSWNDSMSNAIIQIEHIIDKNPSLKKYPQEALKYCFTRARKGASKQMKKDINKFPVECPWTLEEIFFNEE